MQKPQPRETIAELEGERIKAEIDKLRIEHFEIEKRISQRWYDIAAKGIAFLVALGVIVTWGMSVLLPIFQTSEKLAKLKLELAIHEQAIADSKTQELQKKGRELTAHLDSSGKHTELRIKSTEKTLENEKDPQRRNELNHQILSLKSEKKRIESDTKLIQAITKTIKLVINISRQIESADIYIDGELKCTALNCTVYVSEGEHIVRVVFENKLRQQFEYSKTIYAASDTVLSISRSSFRLK